ncbi:MAG: hypothetical protein QXV17_13010 [Candidatus Micrarchaeaceae archaeon]
MAESYCWISFVVDGKTYICDEPNGHEGPHICNKYKVRADGKPYVERKVVNEIELKDTWSEERKEAEHRARLMKAREEYNKEHNVKDENQKRLF